MSTFSAIGGGLPGFPLSDSFLAALSLSGGIETGLKGFGLLVGLLRSTTLESVVKFNRSAYVLYRLHTV